ncbi:MAG: WD-repeat protein, partial [Labilithrix sp.]|nr:WD-repeat protein [Labilithrix sp.]
MSDRYARAYAGGAWADAVTFGPDASFSLRRRFEAPPQNWKLPVERNAFLESMAGLSLGPNGDDAVLFFAAGEGQSMSHRALRWSLARGAPPEPMFEAVVPLTVSRASFSGDGRRIALPRIVSVDEDPTWAGAALAQGVVLWPGEAGEAGEASEADRIGKPFARAERCWPIAFHPDGRQLAVATRRANSSRGIAITLWDIEERRPI